MEKRPRGDRLTNQRAASQMAACDRMTEQQVQEEMNRMISVKFYIQKMNVAFYITQIQTIKTCEDIVT